MIDIFLAALAFGMIFIRWSEIQPRPPEAVTPITEHVDDFAAWEKE